MEALDVMLFYQNHLGLLNLKQDHANTTFCLSLFKQDLL